MWFKEFIILLFITLLLRGSAFTQETPAKKDSSTLYRDIESFSKRSKFTQFIHHMFFKPVASTSQKKNVKKKGYKKLIQKPYSAFEGKTIRHINIETLDPFGYSITDTNAAPKNSFVKGGNSIHVKSQQIAIRNLLLIRQNQLFDSLLVKESERLVRARGYVNDVSFFVKASSKNADSVDIYIRELDKWSLIPKFAVSSSKVTINLTDKNFVGLGHESNNGFIWYNSAGDIAYNINYFVPNLRNTYINSKLHLSEDQNRKNASRSFAVDRPFFSPFAKWAAGVNFMQFRKDSIYTGDSLFLLQRYKFNAQDYWAGIAIRLFKRNENKRTTNFIPAVRFLRIRYLEKPIDIFDPQHMFANEDFYLASVGISTRKYVQDKYIFRFGVTEDVPIGRVYNLTGGYQVKNNTGRFYVGLRFSTGNYHEWGYLSSSFEYGTFYLAGLAEQGAFSAGANYFTGLIEIGKWRFRQFIKPQVTIGINRFPSGDSLTLNEGYGLEGFSSSLLRGTNRLLLTLQTQSYAPWNFLGFRFGPYLNFSLGMLGDEVTGFKNSKMYSQFGLGVLVKNEHLVISTFQISLVYYPSIPGKGQNVFKVNPIKTNDFGFRDFEIGKPASIVFR